MSVSKLLMIELIIAGSIAYYLTLGFVDGIARILMLLGISGIVVLLGWEAVRRIRANISADSANTESIADEIDTAIDTMDESEDYMRRIERLSRKEIDKDDKNKKR